MPERIRLRQSSMQWRDKTLAAQLKDLNIAIPEAVPGAGHKQPLAIGFTEVGPREWHPNYVQTLPRVAKDNGYQLVDPKQGGGAIAVHPDAQIVEHGYKHLFAGNIPGPGGVSGRGITWAHLLTPAGNHVFVHEQHWITQFRLGDEGLEARERLHTLQTDEMLQMVVRHGAGHNVAFWMGDTNVDERRDKGADPNAIHARFLEAGLVSANDALNDYDEGTHGSGGAIIDVIGHYVKDKRVKPIRLNVHGQDRPSDHHLVDVVYEIADLVVKPQPVEHECPSCGNVHSGLLR